MEKSNIGVIGLAVMGENLVLNMESKGYKVSVYNRTTDVVEKFVNGRGKDKNIYGAKSLEDFVDSLKSPKKVMFMIRAGSPVDSLIEQIKPLLDKGDIIIDGGNSNYHDTIRRSKELEVEGLLYTGTGISGGEEGALIGPSIMPGGSKEAWKHLKPIFQNISAKVDDEPCCNYIGENGAGHFVKMVHNGIEYGDMQIISEGYHFLKSVLKLSNDEIGDIFADWNTKELDSYLIEITKDIMKYKDEDGNYVLDLILDSAGQKGTGKWTGISALDIGAPLTLIGESVFARCLSSFKDERVKASELYPQTDIPFEGNKEEMINYVKDALYASKIISYAQGYVLFKLAAKEYEWDLNYGEIAKLWRGGCIIRSSFLNKITEAFEENNDLENILLNDYFKTAIINAEKGWRKVISSAVTHGVPVPALSSALAYFDGYRSKVLPANLLQAQRDFFGAHTYQRVDKPLGEFYHTNWTGKGGSTASSTYSI